MYINVYAIMYAYDVVKVRYNRRKFRSQTPDNIDR